jgi:hypothetical protein
MDAVSPPALYCASPSQEVLLRVSGASREFPTFLKDAAANGAAWKIETDDGGATERTIVMRGPASITYRAVAAALDNAKWRHMNTKVTFDAPRCVGT